MATPTSVDAYIASSPAALRDRLEQARKAIRAAVPDATEKVSYGMATFRFQGALLHLAGYDRHIGLYGASSVFDAFHEEVRTYESGRGTLRFPHEKPLPLGLIERLARARAEQNRAPAASKWGGAGL
jgi:uncharacterized protein YdhG (YjbR/CyaY superfamily)